MLEKPREKGLAGFWLEWPTARGVLFELALVAVMALACLCVLGPGRAFAGKSAPVATGALAGLETPLALGEPAIVVKAGEDNVTAGQGNHEKNYFAMGLGLLNNIKYDKNKIFLKDNAVKKINKTRDNLKMLSQSGSLFDTIIKSLKGAQKNYFTVDQLWSYFSLVSATLFAYYFLRAFSFHVRFCQFVALLSFILLCSYTCKDFLCDVYAYLYVYLIPPALYCINGTINQGKYVLAPPSILLIAIIFTYKFEIPVFICAVFVLINIFYIFRFLYKHKQKPRIMPYVKQLAILSFVVACGYVVSLHLSKQLYYKAYKFFFS
jgi:hypothetical protein